jgi:U3 small nucleolar RNA-associated protein 10
MTTAVSENCSHKTLVSFFTATVIQYLQSIGKVDDNTLLDLLPALFSALKCTDLEVQLASYMIVGQLGTLTSLSVDTCAALVNAIIVNAVDSDRAIVCVILLCQTQEGISVLPEKAVDALAGQAVAATVAKLQASFDCHRFTTLLLQGWIRHGKSSVASQFIQECPLSDAVATATAEVVIKTIGRQKNVDANVAKLFKTLQTRYSRTTDIVIAQKVAATHVSEKEKNRWMSLISDSVSGVRHQSVDNSDTALYLSLKHPEASVRLTAVKKLLEVIAKTSDVSLLIKRRN